MSSVPGSMNGGGGAREIRRSDRSCNAFRPWLQCRVASGHSLRESRNILPGGNPFDPSLEGFNIEEPFHPLLLKGLLDSKEHHPNGLDPPRVVEEFESAQKSHLPVQVFEDLIVIGKGDRKPDRLLSPVGKEDEVGDDQRFKFFATSSISASVRGTNPQFLLQASL